MEFEPVIGIEIHCELKTNTKMFSSAPVNFSSLPNRNVSIIDLAFPGTMPRVNKKAVEMSILAAKALNMEIEREIIFDRKNYFYPDLPKGFQITQQYKPLGKNGFIEIELDNGDTKKIRINRLHMEEDTAKQMHFSNYTLIDYNRCGTPLIEIVSEPDIHSAQEAARYIDNLRLVLLYLGVSDVKMEEGSLRCDINISIRPKGQEKFGIRTEIKNINSISNVEKAINYEIKRQTDVINGGGIVEQETRRFDEETKTTILMRKKTDAVDYKYFCEPNIAPIMLSNDYINEIIEKMPSLPHQIKHKYIDEYGLSTYDSEQLISTKEISDYFNAAYDLIKQPKLIANWILGDIFAFINKNGTTLSSCLVTPKRLSDLIEYQVKGEISSTQAKQVLEIMLNEETPVEKIIGQKGFKQVSDTSLILKLVNEVLDNNKPSIDAYKNGKSNALGFLIGQVMKNSNGQANPSLVSLLIKQELEKR